MKINIFFKVYGSLIVTAVSSVILSVGVNLYTSKLERDNNNYNSYLLLVILGFALLLWGSVKGFKRTESFEKNKERLAQAEKELGEIASQHKYMYDKAFTTLYDILQIYLANLVANELKDTITSSERITVYAHDGKEKGFRQIGRYSPNPVFNRRSSIREFYPEDQGSISVAWTTGRCEIVLNDPAKNLHAYKYELMASYNFTADVVDNIAMKSRLFVGYAIEDSKKNKIGVILFESLELGRLSQNKSKLEAIASDKHNTIQTLIEKESDLRKLFPYKKGDGRAAS